MSDILDFPGSRLYQELAYAADEFLELFNLLFDGDWDITKASLMDPALIDPENGTFINPGVKDALKWADREALMKAYENLKAILGERKAIKSLK